MDYQEFLESKKIIITPCGINVPRNEINPMLFDFQIDIVKRARGTMVKDYINSVESLLARGKNNKSEAI